MTNDGRGAGFAVATVAGQTGIRVYTDPDAKVFAIGDVVEVEQVGGAANAYYVAGRRVSGPRPRSGFIEALQDTDFSGGTGDSASDQFVTSLSPGDLLFGGLGATCPNWLYKERDGAFQIRTGSTVQGVLGQLADYYDYVTSSPVGSIFGEYSSGRTWIGIDNTCGIRIMNYQTQMGRWYPNGDILIGQSAASQPNLYLSASSVQLREGTTIGIKMDPVT